MVVAELPRASGTPARPANLVDASGSGGVAEISQARLRAALEACPEVEAAYLFGSQARGTARSTSDVDVAVIFAAHLEPLERAERRVDLMVCLEALLGRRVDVVDMESSGCVVAHQVLKYGRLLLDRNPRRRIEVEVRLRRAYLDGLHRRRNYLDAVVARLRRGEPLGRPGGGR